MFATSAARAGRPRLPVSAATASRPRRAAALVALSALAALGAAAPPRASVDDAPSAPRPPAVEPLRFRPIAPTIARAINGAQAERERTGPAAAPLATSLAGADAARAVDCLAAAGFYEAGDRRDDQRAVMQVVLNRVRHPAFPKTICAVVFQGAERRTGCQFTFTCDGALTRRAPSSAAWARARAAASEALDGAVYAPVGLATHYHADWMVPYWSGALMRVAQVGPHIFYRWRGGWGAAAAYRGTLARGEPGEMRLALLSGAQRAIAADGPPARGPVRPVLSSASDPDLFLIRAASDAGGDLARARALCGERARCTVLAWRDPGQVARALPLSLEQADALTFRYERADAGEPRARWDCERVRRRDPAQCLRRGALPGDAIARDMPGGTVRAG
ncbi:cell wall hydrolase [Sphingomonas yunnanensis]|uniref:cell wall hydrolase n=1 Tax=Sphingomonas yunnanensis TaxID=310400 RepID=UPI001CA6CD14|nr:cell wall hydrolase [Sphingomonas yunnanensis]MBY9063481.1 cell wall hydrolase [Sphingomonas yunnanensis]